MIEGGEWPYSLKIARSAIRGGFLVAGPAHEGIRKKCAHHVRRKKILRDTRENHEKYLAYNFAFELMHKDAMSRDSFGSRSSLRLIDIE